MHQLLAKDLEAHRSKLSADTERLRVELQESAKVRELRLGVAQPQRVQGLVELLAALRRACSTANTFMYALSLDPAGGDATRIQATIMSGARDTAQASTHAATLVEQNRLYLPSPLAAKVDHVMRSLAFAALAGVMVSNDLPPGNGIEGIREYAKGFGATQGADVYKSLQEIEVEFRALI